MKRAFGMSLFIALIAFITWVITMDVQRMNHCHSDLHGAYVQGECIEQGKHP
jgi:hypothetical protein